MKQEIYLHIGLYKCASTLIQKTLHRYDNNELDVFTTDNGRNIYDKASFTSNSVLLFGSETKGLPKKIRDDYKDRLFRIPMIEKSRSLNLSNAVSIIVYEAWKNLKFCSFK